MTGRDKLELPVEKIGVSLSKFDHSLFEWLEDITVDEYSQNVATTNLYSNGMNFISPTSVTQADWLYGQYRSVVKENRLHIARVFQLICAITDDVTVNLHRTVSDDQAFFKSGHLNEIINLDLLYEHFMRNFLQDKYHGWPAHHLQRAISKYANDDIFTLMCSSLLVLENFSSHWTMFK
ncbi:hypothetical protein Tco_0206852 [Tanacetum coccineum]